jgi:diaminohydroxyphosphoribosylaminopyrimidine deaminase/5-amino-6-(5-phosphoribosylamino)uracil reductase
LKVAASIDGRTALSSGESQWISSKRSRKDVHHWRARSSAILTGSGTVIADDPSLTVRHVDTERQPLRVIVSSNFSIPSGSKLFNEPGNVLVATSENKMPPELIENKRLEVLALPNVNKQVNLQSLMEELSKREINELMVEAGPTLSGAMIANGLVDELLVYLAPTILGDKARSMFDLPLLENLSESIKLSIRDLCLTGDDMRVQLLFTKN